MKDQRGEAGIKSSDLEIQLVETPERLKTSAAIRKSILREFDDDQLLSIAEDHRTLHFLATVHDLPAGTVSCRKTRTGNKIEGLAILEQYRGKGIGKALLRKLAEETDEALYVHAPLALVTWFERAGFIKKGKQLEESGSLYYKMVSGS